MIHPHPSTYSRLLAAVEGCFSFPAAGGGVEGTRGCRSGYYTWENEIITVSTNGERGDGKMSQLLIAVQCLELTYYIKLSPASIDPARALHYEQVHQTINPTVIPTLTTQQHHEMEIPL